MAVSGTSHSYAFVLPPAPSYSSARTTGSPDDLDFLHSAAGFSGKSKAGVSAAAFPASAGSVGQISTGRVLLGFGAAAAFVAVSRRRSAKAHGRSFIARRARGGQVASSVGTPSVGLAQEDQWIANLDLEGFGREVAELGRKLEKEQGEEDMEHLNKIVMWSDVCAAVGLATMWMGPNPVSVIALSLWTYSRWTMLAHHSCHGGYNRTDESGRFSSRGFALGTLWRRTLDWLDWMLPEAWNHEHNQLHHYRLGEEGDPDLVERNVMNWETGNKDVLTIGAMFVWKWYYYAPNTYKELKVAEMRKAGKALPEGFDPQRPTTFVDLFTKKNVFSLSEFMLRVVGPYLVLHFAILPLPFAFFDWGFYWSAVQNIVLAELLTNLHAFITITTNHAGADLYRFERGCKPRSPTFFLRAIVSSTNFNTGGDVNDFMHGWLNYQIEHHVWPNLSMRAYQKGQPQLKAICEKYGVPYVQEDVFTRLVKTYNIFTGRAFMRQYPDHLERSEDMMVWSDARKAATPVAA